MTSYMYNPSKKVTELLSQYLEFDPEQLKIGIWSGNLSLRDVHLRQEAIYPLLNRHHHKTQQQQQSQAAQSPLDVTAAADDAAAAAAADAETHFGKAQPPLRFKLVSGTIGELTLKIPWKRLVWGQGDVQVNLKNIMIVIALESREETAQRAAAAAAAAAAAGHENQASAADKDPDSDDDDDDDDDAAGHAPLHSPTPVFLRERKSKVLREAERRHLQGRNVTAYLEKMRKRNEEALQKELLKQMDQELVRKEGTLEKWLRGATGDFFWRFYAGLQMTVENFKVVIIQDGIEVGFIMPLQHVMAGKTMDRRRSSFGGATAAAAAAASLNVGYPMYTNPTTTSVGGGDVYSTSASGHPSGGGAHQPASAANTPAASGGGGGVIAGVMNFMQGAAAAASMAAEEATNAGVGGGGPPQDVIYEGAYEDGEHVDKKMKFVGFGIYLRKLPTLKYGGGGGGGAAAPWDYYNNQHRPTLQQIQSSPRPQGGGTASSGVGGGNAAMTSAATVVPDVTMREYLVRPVDLDFNFSLFFPYPADKRKKKEKAPPTATGIITGRPGSSASASSPHHHQHHVSTQTNAASSADVSLPSLDTQESKASSSKQRRGKRDKANKDPEAPAATTTTEADGDAMLEDAVAAALASLGGGESTTVKTEDLSSTVAPESTTTATTPAATEPKIAPISAKSNPVKLLQARRMSAIQSAGSSFGGLAAASTPVSLRSSPAAAAADATNPALPLVTRALGGRSQSMDDEMPLSRKPAPARTASGGSSSNSSSFSASRKNLLEAMPATDVATHGLGGSFASLGLGSLGSMPEDGELTPDEEALTSALTTSFATTGAVVGGGVAVSEEQPKQVNQPRHQRRQSIAAPLRGTSAIATGTPKKNHRGPERNLSMVPLARPLARPQNIDNTYATAMADPDSATARLDAVLRVGAIQVVCSTRQYQLLSVFLAAGKRMRNGRPMKTIKSVLSQGSNMRRSLTVRTESADTGNTRTTYATPVWTEVLDHSSDGNTHKSAGGGGGETRLRLELRSTRCERREVIRAWWHYAYAVVVWELRQRSKLRKSFQKRYLSFSWERQRYKRKKYVNLYLNHHLSNSSDNRSSRGKKSPSEELRMIEYELPVEQILLYRAIARDLHVRGMTEMPKSIAAMRAHGGETEETRVAKKRRDSTRSSDNSMMISSVGEENPFGGGALTTVLGDIEKRCMTTRNRRDTGHGVLLPPCELHVPFAMIVRHTNAFDEATMGGMTLDTRATRGGKSTRSRVSMMSEDSKQPEVRNPLNLFLTATMEKLEFMVVEEDNLMQGYAGPHQNSPPSSDSDSSEQTSVSGLTDEDPWDSDGTSLKCDDESTTDPIMASTDFLLFKLPEKTLLRVVITTLSFSARGQTGGSRNVSCRICQVEATSDDGRSLLSIGSISDVVSLSDYALSRDRFDDDGPVSAPADAFSLSAVFQKDAKMVQCDASTVKVTADLKTANQLAAFLKSGAALFPQPVLEKSAREEIRLYVLRQNTATALSLIDASVRLHGFQLLFPGAKEPQKKASERERSYPVDPLVEFEADAILRTDLVEFYSGMAVEDLGNPSWQPSVSSGSARLGTLSEDDNESKPRTRKLNMLDVAELLEGRNTVLSYNWVVASTGLDFSVTSPKFRGEVDAHRSFFENPIDIEVFGTLNADSVFDLNRAKEEYIIEVSPVHMIMSETRLRLLSKVIPTQTLSSNSKLPPTYDEPIPPRLEVLSRFLLSAMDLTVRRARVSLVTDDRGRVGMSCLSKHAQLDDFLLDFLRVVKGFDLSWPHEEALSSAMQICIDRLTGIGFQLDHAWECANTALLNFLEDMAEVQSTDEDGQHSLMEGDSEKSGNESTIRNSVSRTIDLFSDRMPEEGEESQIQNHLVFDLPDGVSASIVRLFYDSHVAVLVPSMFVTNGDGIHILRFTPELQPAEPTEEEELDARSDAVATMSNGGVVLPSSVQHAAAYRQFEVDRQFQFGKGGMPLSVLGEDRDITEDRDREWLGDVEIGDVELLFCQEVFEDILQTCIDIFGALNGCLRQLGAQVSEEAQSNPSSNKEDITTSFLAASTSISALLTTDELVPFSRLTLNEFIAKSGKSKGSTYKDTSMSSKSLSLLNLAPAGELHPEPLSVPPSILGLPFFASYNVVDGDTLLRIELRGLRMYILKQYINECRQYMMCERYGFGLFSRRLNEALEQLQMKSEKKGSLLYEIHMFDCSLLLPRSMTSSDLMAVELDEGSLISCHPNESFEVPTKSTPLRLRRPKSAVSDENKSDRQVKEGKASKINRFFVQLKKFRMFTSMADKSDDGDKAEDDGPAFGFFFGIDGRAEANKVVYQRYASVDNQLIDDGFWAESEKAKRVWQEVTTDAAALEVVADYTPHLRLLICDPADGDARCLGLDFKLPQFCLLLSCWYANMQELPVMFPYTAEQLEIGARLPAPISPFPEYGTKQWCTLLTDPDDLTSEIAVYLSGISLRCSLDGHGSTAETGALVLAFDGIAAHITNDAVGLTRIGVGSLAARLLDESKSFDRVIESDCQRNPRKFSWADTRFGIYEDCRTLSGDLEQSFQFSIFMSPDWSLYNLGMDSAHLAMADFTSIFRLLEFFTLYFADPSLGHPSFTAEESAEMMKSELGKDYDTTEEDPGSMLDFRLWLTRPLLRIPCDALDRTKPSLRMDVREGLWYRYTSADEFSSMECVAKSLWLIYDHKSDEAYQGSTGSGRPLIEGLAFGLRLDYNGDSEHQDISLVIPFVDENACQLTSPRICTQPTVLERPTICSPYEQPHRFLGPNVCEMTCIIEVLPLAWATLLNLFTGGANETLDGDESEVDTADRDSQAGSLTTATEDTFDVESTISFVGCVGDIRIFALDPVLGPHLPVAVASIASVNITASRFSDGKEDSVVPRGEAPPEDLQVLVEGHLWADYFKLGLTRSWEPLVEAYKFSLLYEKSRYRGTGLSLNSDVPLHLNISGALLMILDEVLDAFRRLIQKTFGAVEDVESDFRATLTRSTNRDRILVNDVLDGVDLVHELSRTLNCEDRVAFALKNMTGQMIRAHRLDSASVDSEHSSAVTLSYLENLKSTKLSFQPSISIVKNLQVMEVEYPGLENSPHRTEHDAQGSVHEVHVQLPGFRWLRGIKVDNFGRHFVSLVPRSKDLMTTARHDWRIANVMKLLVEVGLENGGRVVTLRSLFSVVNRTTHVMHIRLHPDPTDDPGEMAEPDTELDPGEQYQVPTLLLESAMRQPGSHLGSFWLRPAGDAVLETFLGDSVDSGDLSVNFSSKPVQLAKAVSQSAQIFEASRGEDVPPDLAKSGVQVSCPVMKASGERDVAPFCYALEIGRSPLVRARLDTEHQKKQSMVHGPVSYTLSVHAPFVVVNLLPERGRFELMHAVRRTVLWFADLEPGQQVSVHSVGLDAPLFLLINLGFCRTPVGEGALVHHGVDPPPGIRENLGGLMSIGKAGKAMTKQLGKTLTSLGESPDKRGHQRLFLANQAQINTLLGDHKPKGQRLPTKGTSDLGLGMGDDEVGGKTYRVDTTTFFPSDCAAETTVVDGVGQRLTLNIENIRGGGGQRRISVFCPFWIINTTEHALRYKQDKSKNFVSGTVLSPEENGSLPLSGGRSGANNRDARDENASLSTRRHLTKGTIFGGTPGALATSAGRCHLVREQLAPLLDKNLSLQTLASLAFMFNFHEGVLSIGNQKLCVQLGDGTGTLRYQSDWSRGFSLDSVGFSQVVLMNCKDLRALEIVVVTQTAPGYLSGYTKIVRFLPRYVVVNNLPYGVRLWQHNSIFRPASSESTSTGTAVESASKLWRFHGPHRPGKIRVNQYEVLWGREAIIYNDEDVEKMPAGTTAHHSAHYVATVLPSTWKPFNLPDSRGDRLLRIDLGGLWNLTASISADVPGEHTLRITRAIDLRLFKHVSTRASPHYDVRLPPSGEGVFAGELGIWFETEWGTDRSLIVKDLKKDSFCFNKTDVHVGDELLLIDGAPVSRMTFAEAMNVLRNRLGELRTKAQQQAQQSEPPPRRPMRRGSLGFAISNRFAGNKPPVEEGSGPVRPLRLTFRTVEERLRRVRLKAAKSSAAAVRPNPASDGTPATHSDAQYDGTLSRSTEPTFMKAELRTLHHSLFLVLGQDPAVPYQVQNRSSSSTIYFRQRGCNGHPWRSLKPGASELYAWEEPMKPRRLSVRVATDSAFSFVNDADADDVGNSSSVPSIRSGEKADVENKAKPSVGKSLFRKVKDEEDAVFSPSVSVRLEEIGFREYLSCGRPSDGFQGEQRHLQLEVDVVSSTRVLVVHDVSSEDGVEQMIRHLESLRNKCTQEERRNNELRAMKSVLSVSALSSYRATAPNDSSEDDAAPADASPEEAIIEAATDLMLDFPEEATISRKHKIVVEVIEAIGLSPDDFVGTCNPYVELHLKSRTAGKSLFSERDLRRTYYVRKSINPTWNSQSFVFDVPPDAVSVTRGHAVKLKVRNYRRIGNHNVLGRAQVDLHSVRNQEPLLGWFPLAGRTGRRELENSLSHWGRGSIKLRVQWVYSTPALFDYFIMLSDARLLDLQESTEGMANQLEKKKEDDQKKREGMDGFKAVRVNDMLPTRRQSIQQKRFQAPKLDDVMKIIEPIRPGFRKNRYVDHDYSEFDESESTPGPMSAGPAHLGGDTEIKKKLAIAQKTTPASLHDLEDRITMQRQSFQSLASNRHKPGKRLSCVVQANHGGKLELASFASWTAAQKLFNHKDLEIQVRRGDIVAELKPKSRAALDPDESLTGSRRVLAKKLHLPASIPKTMALAAREYASSFVESRSSLERSARRSLRAALNPGGWLTVRPVQALNLPDTYNGMFVKLRYGAETLLSETVDSTVYPTWIKAHPQPGDSRERDVPAESLEFFPNDLHIYVAPQKTSGSIRLSVVGEGRHQSLTTRAELGVLHIPLGAAIAACIDCIEEFLDSESEESSSSPVYVRWFPLMNSKDTVPVEGDRGLGWRPRESEKIGDDLFKEYFAPCIQLALIWSPDVERSDANDDDEAIGGPRLGPALSSHHPSLVALSGGATRMVENYFNADIGHISVALIDSQRAFELAACAVSDIDVRYWVTKAKTRFGLAVGWFQLDQQDDAAREPVMIAPTPHDFVSTVVQILAVKDNLRSKTDVLSFEFIDVSIAEFDLTMEESFLFDLFDFFSSLRLRRGMGLHSSIAQGTGVDIIAVGQGQSLLDLENPVDESNEPTLYSILTSEGRDTKGETRVYIEQLFLGVVKFNLSYLKGKKEGWKPNDTGWTEMGVEDAAKVAIKATGETLIRTFSYYHEKSDVFTGWSQHTSREDRASEGRGSYNLPTMVASLFPNVSDAPVRLQGKALNHVFESPREIIQSIKKYYVNETLGQIYKIIGSLDFVGNPTMVLTSFMSGVRDLVVQPSMAFTNSPGDLSRVGIGVAKGTLSLFSHSFSGFFGFLAKISAAAGQGLATLSLDKDYRSWHRDQIVTEATNLNRTWKRRGVQSARQMVTRPIGDILLGVGSGISGIVFSPYKGYQRGGHIGMINGVAVGIVGVVVRPVVGVLDAFSHFTATIHDVAKSVNVLEKRFQPAIKYRLPYVFGTKHVLTPFDDTTARAVYFLKKFPPTKARRAASQITEIVVHVELLPNIGTDTLAILTNVRLILIRVKKEPSGALSPSVCWEVAVVGGATVSSRIEEHGHNGVALTITVKTSVNQEAAEAAARSDGNADTGGDTEEGSVQPEGLRGMEGLERAEEFEFGTGRSKEGELLEWFTVVAEYQYRRQLARLHNALSCTVGDFDSVLWDKFLGRPGSTEGFTRFGIFSFEPQSAELERFETSVDPFERSLEHAPWMSEGAFGEIGPDWLVTARAEGAYLNSNQLESSSSSYFSEDGNQGAASTMENNRGVRKFARWLTSRLPTIPDKDMDEEEEVITTPTRRTPDSGLGQAAKKPPAALERGDSFDSEDSAFKSAESSDVTPDEKSSSNSMSLRPKGRLSINSSLYQSARSHMSDEDLADSPSSSPVRRIPQPRSQEGLDMIPMQHPPSAAAAAAAAASSTTRPRPELDRALSAPSLLQPTESFDRILNIPTIQDGRAPFTPTGRDGQPPMDIPQAAHAQRGIEGGWATEYEVRTKYKMHHQQQHHQQVSRDLPSRSSQRLERMEALMERLLIFSTEQSMQQNAASPPRRRDAGIRSDADSLWWEVRGLRAQLRQQQEGQHLYSHNHHHSNPPPLQQHQENFTFSDAQEEIATLRGEIEALRHRIESGATSTQASSQNQSSDDEHSERFEV